MKRVKTSRHTWLIAGDANMCPEDFEESLWLQSRHLFIEALTEASMCMEVVEDFESRPHKAVSFVVERDKEVQVWREHRMPKARPGFSGGKKQRRKKAKKKRARRRRARK